MLFHPNKRYVFIAVPKTGTTSIENLITRIDREALLNQVIDANGSTVRVNKHARATEVRELMGDSAGSFTFVGFVRDPRELIYSKYFFYRNGWPYEKWAAGELTTLNWNWNRMKNNLAHRVLLARALPLTWWARIYPLKPNCYFLLDARGDLAVDRVGRFDRLQSDFTAIFSKLGYSADDLELSHSNATPYSLSTKERVTLQRIASKKLRCDFELYESVSTPVTI